MMKRFKIFFSIIVLCSVSLISCGDSGGGDDDPDTYIKIEEVGGTSKTYKAGLSDKTSGKPFSYTTGGSIDYLAFPTSIKTSDFDKNSTTRISIKYSNNKGVGTYSEAAPVSLSIKVLYDSEINGGSILSTNSGELIVTEYGDYNEGTFTFTGDNTKSYTGSFVVKHLKSDPFN